MNKTIKNLKEGSPVIITALGDSLTQGWMVNKGYCDFLAEMLQQKFPASNFKIINKGIPGNTAEQGLLRLDRDVIENDPDLVFIQFALNDAYTGYSYPEFKKIISRIIKRIKNKTNAEILLITSVPLMNERENRHAELFYSQLEELSDEEKIPISRVHDYWKKKIKSGINFHDLVQEDGVHPTEMGYKLMAESIIQNFSNHKT